MAQSATAQRKRTSASAAKSGSGTSAARGKSGAKAEAARRTTTAPGRTRTTTASGRTQTTAASGRTRTAAASGGTRSTAAKGDRATPAARARDGHAGEAHHTAGLAHHTAHATVPIPYLTPADMAATARTAASHLPSALPSHLPSAVPTGLPSLPSRERLAFYGGLGALAVAGAVDWPVALAVGAAAAVARSGRRPADAGPARARPVSGQH